MDASYSLARNVIDTKYESLPDDTVETTKIDILDTLGVALAGSTAPGIKPLVELLQEWGGKEESTVFAYGGKLPVILAAQANASMAHARDYDDTHTEGSLHIGVVVVTTALAMAERKGGVSGKDIITAVTLGLDIAVRMSSSAIKRRPEVQHSGWHPTALYGYFSAAATAGKILGLDEEKMVNAFGIAYHQAAGNNLHVYEGAMTKRMGAGFAAKAGIQSALMAERGITGVKNSLETKDLGLYDLYHSGLNRDKLLGGLGKDFKGTSVSIKPYPCCRLTHHYIDVVLELVNENDIKPDEVESITTMVHSHSDQVVCQPTEAKHDPRNIIDCQFSVPWTVASAVVNRKVGLSEFTEEALKETAIRQMAKRVNCVVDNSLPNNMAPGLVTIKTKKGEFSRKGGAPLGEPENPISQDALIAKFMDCASWAVKPLPKNQLDKVVDAVMNLEKLGDASQIPQLLA